LERFIVIFKLQSSLSETFSTVPNYSRGIFGKDVFQINAFSFVVVVVVVVVFDYVK